MKPSAENHLGEHFCPACGRATPGTPRYPWHVCRFCVAECRDRAGRLLEFTNVSASGGLGFRRRGESDWSDEVSAIKCLLSGRPVLVRDARFGGIVVEPHVTWRVPETLLDLTKFE